MSFPPFRPLRNENDFSLLESKLEDPVYLKIFQKMIKKRCKKNLPKLSVLFNDIYLNEFNLAGICGKNRLLDTRIYDVYFELMLENGVNADEVGKYARKELECIKNRVKKRRQYRNKQIQNALQPIASKNQSMASSARIVQQRRDIEHNYVSKSKQMSSYTVNIIVDVPKEGLELKKKLNFLIESVKDVHQNLFFAVNVDKHSFDCVNCNQKYVLNLVHEENVFVGDDNDGFEDDTSVKEEVFGEEDFEEGVFEEEVESWPISTEESVNDVHEWENTQEVKDEQIPRTLLAPRSKPDFALVEITPSLPLSLHKRLPVSDSKGTQIRLYTVNPPRFKLPIISPTVRTNSEQFSHSCFKDEQIPDKRKNYRCEICGQRFLYQSILNNHRCPKGPTHQTQQEQSLVCHLCGISFTKKSKLQYHLNDSSVHQERLYECHYCSIKFLTKRNVARHIKRHFPSLKKPQDPITCKICAQSFKAASYLQRHLRTVHEGQKSYQCHLCTKQFTSASYLKIHIGLHQNGNKYPCKFCKVTYRDPGTLACHMRKIHPIEYEVYKNKKKFAVYE